MFAGNRGRRRLGIVAVSSTVALAGSVLSTSVASAATDTVEVPVFAVVQEGMTAEQGAQLAKVFRTENALASNGLFSYVDASRFGRVPLAAPARAAEDESGHTITPQALDYAALRKLKPVSNRAALARGAQLVRLAGLGADLAAKPVVTHTQLTLTGATRGAAAAARAKVYNLDTVVSYRLSLAGLPVTGQGAKLRLTVGPDGAVTQLTQALRKVERAGTAPVIGAPAAQRACAALYGRAVRQGTPTLGYQFPELTATEASGKGTVAQILPQYTCNPLATTPAQARRLVPAVAGSAPTGKLQASRQGAAISASVEVAGGTAPYTFTWSSSSTALPSDGRNAQSISYERAPRDREDSSERVTVEVVDANGLTATAALEVNADGSASGETQPGGGGFGALAIGPTDVGEENMVDEWQCAQDSANGFKSVMNSHNVPSEFDFRGASAWENDFKDPSAGGHDDSYVDNVDAAWYTGHGWSGGFTFKGNHSDTSIVPSDARWGNGDLEWLQLESCQVLADTNGHQDYFGRWRQSFAGLHVLNGFHTSAYCVGGGTGATFADYLFPKKFLWWTTRPAYRVQSAWAAMAIDREPSGVVYRSMGLVRSDGVTNIGDHFWGQGATGPDIALTPTTGQWAISGTV